MVLGHDVGLTLFSQYFGVLFIMHYGNEHSNAAIIDEGTVKPNQIGRRMYLWRAVDDEGEVLDILVQNAAIRRPH
jgi:hypothetical protein